LEINFQQISPIWQLKSFIDRIWLFESSGPMPSDDMKLVVPNGRLLLLMPFRNGLTGQKNDRYYLAPKNSIALVGMSDCPSIVDAEFGGAIGTIGLEISAAGAYRFFHLRLKDIKNQLHLLTDLIGRPAKMIEQRISEAQNTNDKILMLQQFLLSLLAQSEEDALFEYCIRQINISGGSQTVKQLERETGYTSRWLNLKFEERLGISPKNYSSIMRFQRFYRAMLSDPNDFFRQKSFYDHYYDESHFIKEFKRFTDMPPARLISSKNEFGRTFYQD
jgi:AraC-like DNA-binding protein